MLTSAQTSGLPPQAGFPGCRTPQSPGLLHVPMLSMPVHSRSLSAKHTRMLNPPAGCHHGEQVIEAALENANMQREQIDWLVMHQVGRGHV